MAPKPPQDKRGITFTDDDGDGEMELVDRTGRRTVHTATSTRTEVPPELRAPPEPPSTAPASPRPFSPEALLRLTLVRQNQERSGRILRAVRELLEEKGLL